MSRVYIHELAEWPQFRWDWESLDSQFADVHRRLGVLFGRMDALGFELSAEKVLESLTEEIQKSNEIEGEWLDREQVRSSIARHLGMDTGALVPSGRNVDGVVNMMLDATRHYEEPLTQERLFRWHADLFPARLNGRGESIEVGRWRDDSAGPMQVVSASHSRMGQYRVHYVAPAASRLEQEMARFLDWFEDSKLSNSVLKAAIAHLWFVTIHPFEDGNGRIARVIADMALARFERSSQRYYSMSAQIKKEQQAYYEILEYTLCGDLDITPWISWFLGCLERAIEESERVLKAVLARAHFWQHLAGVSINERQKEMLNRLLDGFVGKLNTSKWAKITKCSQDTAYRDILDLIEKGALVKDEAGGRTTSYSLCNPPIRSA